MKWKVRALSVGALGLVFAACGREEAPEAERPAVIVAPVAARELVERIEATGALRAPRRALVAAEVGGRVTEIVRDEGSDVGEADVVLSIDPERYRLENANARARLAEAAAALSDAEREYARIGALRAKGVAAQAKVDQMETQLRLARSRHEAARAGVGIADRALADSMVRAPFAGSISARRVSAGEFVGPGTPLFELVAMDPIEAEFSLPEADASRVRNGQDVALRVAPWPDEVFRASVTFVSPTVDAATHTLLVRAALANPDHRLRPGLFARVDLGVAQRAGIPMIPEESVLQRADGEVAFRLGPENRVQRLVIKTGVHRDGEVEVVEGLGVGDRVVVRGHYALSDGVVVDSKDQAGDSTADVAGGPAAGEQVEP
jgi:membrane fusion protein (multidrug efflux system)